MWHGWPVSSGAYAPWLLPVTLYHGSFTCCLLMMCVCVWWINMTDWLKNLKLFLKTYSWGFFQALLPSISFLPSLFILLFILPFSFSLTFFSISCRCEVVPISSNGSARKRILCKYVSKRIYKRRIKAKLSQMRRSLVKQRTLAFGCI